MDGRFDQDARRRAARALRPFDNTGRERLERFVRESGYVVTTGQQPGLFTGPLYSLYKGLTAIALAARLEERLGKPVLPVFWVASEDHDWAEVNHTWVLDAENELHRIEVADPLGASGRPIFRIELSDGLGPALDAFERLCPPTEFRDGAMDVLRAAYGGRCTLDGGFRRTVEALLGPLGLFTTDAADPVVKEVSKPLLLGAIRNAAEHEAVLTATAGRLENTGYETQVSVIPGGINLFLEGPGGRERLYRADGGVELHTSGTVLSVDDVLERVEADPHVLSPNVLLRPVVESAVFPTLSYVGGPGEVAYFAQLADYFEMHGIRMPVVHPRVSVTLVESKVSKVLDKLELTADTLARPFHEVAADFAREEMPSDVAAALGQLRGAVGKGAGELLAAARAIDPTLKGPIQHARNAAFAAFNDAEKKILQSVKRNSEIVLAQVEKAQVNVFPRGLPQERVLNVFQYLVRYGPDLVAAIGERVGDQLRIMEVEAASPRDA